MKQDLKNIEEYEKSHKNDKTVYILNIENSKKKKKKKVFKKNFKKLSELSNEKKVQQQKLDDILIPFDLIFGLCIRHYCHLCNQYIHKMKQVLFSLKV